MFFPYHIQWGSRPSDKGRSGGGGGGKVHPDPEIRRGRSCLIRIRIRVWFKNRGERAPRAPPGSATDIQSTFDNSNLQGKSKKGSSYWKFEENSRE